MNKRKYICGVFATLVVTMLIMPVVTTTVKADPYTVYFPSSEWGAFYSTTPASGNWGGGGTEAPVSAVAYPSSGYVYSTTGAWSDFAGVHQIDSKAGFTHWFTAQQSGNVLIEYLWQCTWTAQVATSVPFFSAGMAEGYIKFGGNLLNDDGYWALSGDRTATAWNVQVAEGLMWGNHNDDQWYVVNFRAQVTQGESYMFYTYMETHCKTACVGLGMATAANNVGSDGNYAWLRYMYIDYNPD